MLPTCRVVPGALALASALCVVSCAPEGVESVETGLLDGVSVIDVGSAAVLPALPWQVHPEPRFRVGAAVDLESHQFTDVTAAAKRADGSVVVADGRAGVVRVYDTRGHLRMPLGATGRGPGEFQSPSGLLVGAGDSVVVWDRALWRTSVFGPDGAFVRSERYDPADPAHYPVRGMWPAGIDLGGGGSRIVSLMGKGGSKDSGAADPGRVAYALHGPSGDSLTFIADLPGEEIVRVDAPWGQAEMAPPLSAGTRAAAGARGSPVCVGHQRLPEVLCVGDGGIRHGIRWSGPSRPLSGGDPEVEAWREETISNYALKMTRAMAEEVVGRVPVPALRPAFAALRFDALGHLWVELGPSIDDPGRREHLVFGPGLAPLGRIVTPRIDILEIGSDYVLGVRADSLGVDEVVEYGLTR